MLFNKITLKQQANNLHSDPSNQTNGTNKDPI